MRKEELLQHIREYLKENLSIEINKTRDDEETMIEVKLLLDGEVISRGHTYIS